MVEKSITLFLDEAITNSCTDYVMRCVWLSVLYPGSLFFSLFQLMRSIFFPYSRITFTLVLLFIVSYFLHVYIWFYMFRSAIYFLHPFLNANLLTAFRFQCVIIVWFHLNNTLSPLFVPCGGNKVFYLIPAC